MPYNHFTIEERERLQTLWWERRSMRDIAKVLGRSHASVSRELRRNFPPEREQYTPRLAQERASAKKKERGRHERLKNDRVRAYVVTHLKRRWSPEQIALRIKIDMGERISHEAIYQYVYHQVHRDGYGLLKPRCEDLRMYLRRRRKRRIPKGSRRCQRAGNQSSPSIEDRPAVVNDRKRIGDWEGDTVESRDHRPGVNTLVERKTGYTFITKLHSKSGLATREAMSARLTPLPAKLRRTVTLDNGPENRDWRQIEEKVGIKCFFAHPYCSGERGTNENTNGLIRDYFPKKTDFRMISEEEIRFVERELNDRPRKRLGGRKPRKTMSG